MRLVIAVPGFSVYYPEGAKEHMMYTEQFSTTPAVLTAGGGK